MYKDSNKQGLGGTDKNGKQKRFCLSNQPLVLHSDDHTIKRVDPKKADSPRDLWLGGTTSGTPRGGTCLQKKDYNLSGDPAGKTWY